MTVDLVSAVSGEKTNAAFCFGLAYQGDSYSCTYDAVSDGTLCQGSASGYYVLYFDDPSGLTVGIVYDAADDSEIGRLAQDATGTFVINFSQAGLAGECIVVGDVATLCVVPAP